MYIFLSSELHTNPRSSAA